MPALNDNGTNQHTVGADKIRPSKNYGTDPSYLAAPGPIPRQMTKGQIAMGAAMGSDLFVANKAMGLTFATKARPNGGVDIRTVMSDTLL